MQTTSWEDKRGHSPLGRWNKPEHKVWSSPYCKWSSSISVQRRPGCSYVISWLCLVTTAGKWGCGLWKAVCHLLSDVSSAVLWNEPDCKAKPTFLFLFGKVIFNLDHSAIPLTVLHSSKGSTVRGKQAGMNSWSRNSSSSFTSEGHVLHNCSLSLGGDSSDKANRG